MGRDEVKIKKHGRLKGRIFLHSYFRAIKVCSSFFQNVVFEYMSLQI